MTAHSAVMITRSVATRPRSRCARALLEAQSDRQPSHWLTQTVPPAPHNLNQPAKHAKIVSLDVSQDIEQQRHDARKAVGALRDALKRTHIPVNSRPMTVH